MTVYYTGNSGLSTGPHLDLQVFNPSTGKYEDSRNYTSFLTVGDDRTPFNYQVTSERGMRIHPKTGKYKMHEGNDFAVPTGTALNVDGKHMSTWNDAGGGVMSQYLINTDDGYRELLLLHGNNQNQITGSGALTDYDPESFGLKPSADTPGSTADVPSDGPQVQAKERAVAYQEMTKAQMNAEYDRLRSSDPAKAAEEGMKMHKAFFKKP